MNIEIRYKGALFAHMPASPSAHVEMTMPDGRLLHVGPDGAYFKQPIVPGDQIMVMMS